MRRVLSLLFLVLSLAALAGCDKNSKPTAPVVPLSSLQVSPSLDTLRIGETALFSAVALDTLGNPVDPSLRWISGNVGVFTVTGGGRVRGVGEGTAPLIVEAGALRDTAWITVYPDTGWFQQASGTTFELNAVYAQPDGRTVVAVGDGGTIVRSTDAGASWTRPPTGTSFNLYGVRFTSSSEGWAVGNAGTVLRTVNGGASWSRVTTVGVSDALDDVWFASPDTGWAVGAAGLVVRTFDRGATWQSLRLPTPQNLQGVAFAGTRDGWAVGSGGAIAGTHDRGLTWFFVPSITTLALQDVWRNGAATAWAVGMQGAAPRTVATPDSVAWELRNAGANRQLEGVHFPTDLVGYAVGYDASLGGAILRTDDGGLTWQSQASHTGARLNDVFFVDPLHGWAVGEAGTIVHTARGGRQ